MTALTKPNLVVTAPRYRPISDEGLAFITGYESFRSYAYDDKQPKRTRWTSVDQINGVPTIGFGHTKGVTKLDVVNRRRCTKEQALAWKREDLNDAYARIDKVMGKRVWDMTQGQYDALVAFVFNAGLDPSWQIAKLLKQGRFGEVPDQMIRFVNSGGERMQGLVNRRRAEIDMWRAGEVVATGVRPDGPVEVAPAKSLFASRTWRASILAGVSGVGTGTTAAIAQLAPHANEGMLKTIMVIFVTIGTISAFVASMLKAQDQQGARA